VTEQSEGTSSMRSMSAFSSDVLRSWLEKHFDAHSASLGQEMTFPCPRCDHPSFFFNLRKGVGFCHHASCHWKPTVAALVEVCGVEPDQFSYTKAQPTSTSSHRVILPEPHKPILVRSDDGELLTWDQQALSWLLGRGLALKDVERFDLQSDAERIYVPIKEDGKLVNWVGRLKPGVEHPRRYLYAPGVSTTHYLFGWDECKHWPTLVLVENTFNAIWLRNELHCTTNFGSYLSETQARKISQSKVRSVAILWDEGAGVNAEKAVLALRNQGVAAAYLRLTGQPDNHDLQFLKEKAIIVHEHARLGRVAA